jgi:hypothetical protein
MSQELHIEVSSITSDTRDNKKDKKDKKLLGVIYGIGMNVNNVIGAGL